MAVFKWLVLFLCAFCMAFVVVVTFSQAPFKEPVSAVIFTYKTASIPLYWYVIGALGVGLIVGLIVALYYFIVLKHDVYKKNKTIQKLEETLAEMELASKKNDIPEPPETKLVTNNLA
jgi:hypothetical protein